jgi:hypothetical protein
MAKHGKKTNRHGGFLGSLINQAIVPFGILGLQQTYRRNKRGGKKTHKNMGGRHHGSRRHH